MSDPAIHVENLSRCYGNIVAVDNLSFTVEKGKVVGFIGANGAGKTTTMRILATLDYPDTGHVFICGINVVNYPEKIRALLGWMPDSYGSYHHMTVLEYLDFYARSLGFRGEERRMRIRDVMEFTDLVSLADRLTDKLSKGMAQKLCLGRALMHDPQVLIMDEPAAGLDPKARVELKHLIRILAEEGKTIFISSHILSELGEMCDALLFINHGKIVHYGSAESLQQEQKDDTTIVDVKVAIEPGKLHEWVELNRQVHLLETRLHGGRIRIDSKDRATVAFILKKMVQDGLPVIEFRKEERKLEDAFIDILEKVSQLPEESQHEKKEIKAHG